MYSDLFVRNKLNHSQIEKYFSYSKTIKDHIDSLDTKDFYFYQEEALTLSAELPERAATDRKI